MAKIHIKRKQQENGQNTLQGWSIDWASSSSEKSMRPWGTLQHYSLNLYSSTLQINNWMKKHSLPILQCQVKSSIGHLVSAAALTYRVKFTWYIWLAVAAWGWRMKIFRKTCKRSTIYVQYSTSSNTVPKHILPCPSSCKRPLQRVAGQQADTRSEKHIS